MPARRSSRSRRRAMFTTICTCTQEWSDMCSRSAFVCCMYHHALSCVSPLAFAIRRSSERLRSLGARIAIAATDSSTDSLSVGGGSAMRPKLATPRDERVSADAPGLDVHAAHQLTAGLSGHVLYDRGPHVQLHLLGHQQPVVHDRRQPVAAAGP